MSIIDTAISRVQTLALAVTTSKVKAAPDYPVEDASVLPLVITHITSGTAQADNATNARLLLNLSCDVHFDRISIKNTYKAIDGFIPEFLQRLAGDPTLGGAVETIIYPVTFSVSPAEWDSIVTQMVSFTIPVKFLETPI